MKKITKRDKQTIRFLKWINKYPGWWQLICTPNDEHMNINMMNMLIKHLAQEQLYEIIFVLLMVHRKEKYVKIFPIPCYLIWCQRIGEEKGKTGNR